MKLKKILTFLVIAGLVALPLLTTGCGSDDTTQDSKLGVHTIGPGALETEQQIIEATTKSDS